MLSAASVTTTLLFVLSSNISEKSSEKLLEGGVNNKRDASGILPTRTAPPPPPWKDIKILLVGNNYKQQFPLIGYGGIEAHVEAMADGLERVGAQFRVIVPRIVENRRNYTFPVLETPSPSGNKNIFVREVRNIVKDLHPQPDIIWSVSDWSANVLHDLGIPMIVCNEDSGGGIRLRSYPNVLYRFLTHNQRRRWMIKQPWLQNKSFALWPGFSYGEFALETEKEPNTLLFVGSLSPAKGLPEFETLASWNPDWKFIVYGPGSFRSSYPNVEFRGELKRGEGHCRAFQKASKFFMFVKWEEAFGRTVVEALSKGTPVLGSMRGSLPELIVPSVGVVSDDLTVLNASLRTEFEAKTVFDYSQRNFDAVIEIEELLRRSLDMLKHSESLDGIVSRT